MRRLDTESVARSGGFPLRATALAAAVALFVSGCAAGGPTRRETGIGTGAAIGAGTGAIIGSTSGDAAEGALIGGAIGAIAGGLLGDRAEAQDQQSAEMRRRLEAQEAELARNRELLESLRARNLSATATERGVVVTLPDVLFEFGSANLTGSARSAARDIADVLKQHAPGRAVAVEGHTDSVGPEDYNQGLSERRARSVADALAANGISRRLLVSRGLGESYPVAPNRYNDGTDNPDGRRRNRRVEVVISSNPA